MREQIPVDLITRYLSSEATPTEEKVLFDWISREPQHEIIFNEYVIQWTNTNDSLHFDLEKGLQHINTRINEWELGEKHHKNTNFRYRMAAAIGFAITVGSLLFLLSDTDTFSAPVPLVETNTTPGQQKSVPLSDSSHIILNATSRLTYPAEFSTKNREVTLQGEAFFNIAKDKDRPFLIHTGEFTTHVVGTSFNIKSDSTHVIVSVASGIVKVYHQQDTAVLLPGDQALYSRNTQGIIVQKANLEEVLAWQQHALYLRDTPLSATAEKLYQSYGFTSTFETDAMRQIPITGKFKNEPLENILHVIQFSTGLHCEVSDSVIHWTRNRPKQSK